MSILASITLKQVGSQYSCSECSVAYSNRTHKESQQERNKNINNEKLQRNPNHLDEINPLLALLLKTNSPRNVEIKRQALSAISALVCFHWEGGGYSVFAAVSLSSFSVFYAWLCFSHSEWPLSLLFSILHSKGLSHSLSLIPWPRIRIKGTE